MQLILHTETTIDIKRTMSTLNEESLVEKLEVIQELKSNIYNSNKENIESQDNIITSDDKELNSENEKGNNEEISALKSPEPSESVDTKIVNDKNKSNNDDEDSVQQTTMKHTHDIVNQQDLAELTIDTVEKPSSEKICSSINQQVSEATLDVFEEKVSEGNLGAVELETSNEGTIRTAKQEAPSEGILETDEQQVSIEKTTGVDDQQAVSEKPFGAQDSQNSNEDTLDVVDQTVSKEKTLDVNDQQATNEKFRDVDDQQPANENSLGVANHQFSNKGIVDESFNKKTFDVDDQPGHNKETTLDIVQQQISSEKTLSVFKQQASSEGRPHSSGEPTLVTVPQQTSTEKTLSAVEQQASSADNLNVGYQKLSSKETFEVAERLADSVVTPSIIDQQGCSEESLNIHDEPVKDDDSDPIIISYEKETRIEEKEKLFDKDQEVNSLSKNHVQISDNILITDNCVSSKEDIEIVELDDEEKDLPIGIPLEVEKQKESIEIINDELITNKPEPSMTEDKSSHSQNTSAKEKEITCEPMEVDNNSENCVKKNTELISEEEKTVVTLEEMDNQLDQNDKKGSSQTKVIDIASHSNAIVNDTESAECKNITRKEEPVKKEENSECKKDIEVDDVVLQKEKSEETLSSEQKITNKTEIHSHGNKLSEDLKNIPSVLKLSNTLDILSDDEDIEPLKNESQSNELETFTEKQCINIEDDDDIMLIDEEDTNSKDNKNEPVQKEIEINNEIKLDNQTIQKSLNTSSIQDNDKQKESSVEEEAEKMQAQPVTNEKTTEFQVVKAEKPLVPSNFLKSCKKNLADMTREDLEEFCILKIVESIVDRSNLSDIKAKLKTTSQNIEEYKKKAMMLTKQNRDLQVVLKSIQEELKKSPGSAITPLKITRSVGMQVLMTEKTNMKRKVMAVPTQAVNGNNPSVNKSPRTSNPSPRPIKPAPPSQTIPVPRLVPAGNNVVKNVNTTTPTTVNNSGKAASPLNGIKTTPIPKVAEKRPLNKVQSMTVDLTDDEPPAKVITRSSPVAAPPVRLLHPLAQNSPRKVYIPISGPQGQNIRPGQTIMLKSVPSPGPRPRGSIPTPRLPQNQIRMPRIQNRHPAPLPEVKQYQTNHYKALPPAPDLKLSKVENGIVISWKIEGYQEDSYEEIASYQLYAYQESSSPPSTALWKKIGDVKALPLPMACTLTQFMAGFKYYFAVRAVDVRSRFGPFSLPGSILLLNKI